MTEEVKRLQVACEKERSARCQVSPLRDVNAPCKLLRKLDWVLQSFTIGVCRAGRAAGAAQIAQTGRREWGRAVANKGSEWGGKDKRRHKQRPEQSHTCAQRTNSSTAAPAGAAAAATWVLGRSETFSGMGTHDTTHKGSPSVQRHFCLRVRSTGFTSIINHHHQKPRSPMATAFAARVPRQPHEAVGTQQTRARHQQAVAQTYAPRCSSLAVLMRARAAADEISVPSVRSATSAFDTAAGVKSIKSFNFVTTGPTPPPKARFTKSPSCCFRAASSSCGRTQAHAHGQRRAQLLSRQTTATANTHVTTTHDHVQPQYKAGRSGRPASDTCGSTEASRECA